VCFAGMMENFVGENDFRVGLKNFLEKFSFRTAVTEDLLDELSLASTRGLDVKKVVTGVPNQARDNVVLLFADHGRLDEAKGLPRD